MEPKFQYRIYKSSSNIPIWNQINPTINLNVSLPGVLLPLGVPAKNLCEPLPYLSVLHSPSLSFFSFDHQKSIRWGVPRYRVFSSPLLPHPPWAQISPPAPFFKHPLSIFLKVKGHYSIQYKITVLHIFIFI
jgi:hypothetical protein